MRRSFLYSSALILPLATSLAGCGDPLRITASEPVLNTTLQVYPFSRVPPTYPAGINTVFALPVSVTASGNFDVAFDVDAEGNIILLTPRAMITPLAGVHRVGFLHAGASFEGVLAAPAGPYAYDSLLTIVPGEVVVIESHRGSPGDICSFALAPNIYSKLRISFVNAETSAMTVDFTVDPNCGFRSFEPGIPQN
jgi:hypothetical protein